MTKLYDTATPTNGADQSARDLDLSITVVDARASGFVRDAMCFNKV